MLRILLTLIILHPIIGFSQTLTNSTNISITKTWFSQPSGYTYPINISVPNGPVPPGGFPVCILLHGNGSMNPGLAGPSMLGPFQFGNVLPCHILVAPTGFQNSWNICAENSDAPDVDMINDLVTNLQSYSNVNPYKIRILGTSNGAGLANRFFIENINTGIDIVCAVVSHLNDFQYHSGNFYKPSGITDSNSLFCGYDVVSNPLLTTKYLSISNINDSIINYLGGASVVGANFLPAETAAHNIASYKGYTGNVLTSGTIIGSGPNAITEFSYLSGDVVHIKGSAGHQANTTQKDYIAEYFSDCATNVGIEDIKTYQIRAYPNPTVNIINIAVIASLIGVKYVINDNLGRPVLFGKINSENSDIDLSDLSRGFYHLIIEGDLKQAIKVVKK
jgi:poly(3-hydroxybutyrate) depolymerase